MTRGDPSGRATVRPVADAPSRLVDSVASCSTLGAPSLPHRSAEEGARFALESFDVATVGSLPRRSPAESAVNQALSGIDGVTMGQYGTVAIDVDRLDPEAPVTTRLDGDEFGGLRAFLRLAVVEGHEGPVAWHVTGPVSVAGALMRAGAAPRLAFDVACSAVRHRVRTIAAAVSDALPRAPQLAVLDEAVVGRLWERGSPLSRDEVIDALSSAMAAGEPLIDMGVHCCHVDDIALVVEAGPHVLSVPVPPRRPDVAVLFGRFLAAGGWIAWGAVPTTGPIGSTAARSWGRLAATWTDLARVGCDPDRLRSQALLTPQCGLGAHGIDAADGVCRTLAGVALLARSTPPH
jgi:hypothetical protein